MATTEEEVTVEEEATAEEEATRRRRTSLTEDSPEERRLKKANAVSGEPPTVSDSGIPEEDCEIVGDEDGYGNRSIVGVDETQCEDFVAVFGQVAGEDDELVSDGDSADDIWEDDRIPNPISSDNESESEDETPTHTQPESPEDYLRLGKTFNCPEDFRIAVLRYSLKTKYDVVLYRSQSLRIGAKCSEVNCQWRCYCSYEKEKKKMQIKVYVAEHSCVRSGYTKMLKKGTIAYLLAERLRKNPKMTPVDMVEEIKNEYNLTVTENQCAKAKTKVLKDRKATHEEHFSRIWDYQAEIFRWTSMHGSKYLSRIERLKYPLY